MGFFSAWSEMSVSLYRSRELIWRLFLRDFNAKYRQSILGFSWAVLNPLITVGIFVYLNKAGIFNIGSTNVPYPIFALVSLTVWSLFAKGLTVCSNSIVSAGTMVTKINFPKSTLVISSMGQAVIEFIIRLGLTLSIFLVYKVSPSWSVVFFPFAAIPVFLLTLGLGFFFSLLTGVIRDTVNIVTLLTTFLLFLIPVLYPAPETGLLATVNKWNPLSHLIIACRDIVFIGNFTNPVGYWGSTAFSLFVFIFFWRFFYIAESKIAERI